MECICVSKLGRARSSNISDLWCLTVSILLSMMLVPASALPGGTRVWLRTAARARDYSKQADMDEDNSLGSEQKERV